MALIPAICWGSIVFINVKLGGDAFSQVLGTVFGACVFTRHLFHKASTADGDRLDSERGVWFLLDPRAATGMQLVSTSLVGVLVFKEWSKTTTIILGSLAIILIIIVFFTVLGKAKQSDDAKRSTTKGIIILLISTLGYLVYVSIIKWFGIDGWHAILPQSIGMVVGGVLLTLNHHPYNKYAFRNILAGIWWGIGNLGLLLALSKVGQATSYSLSQTGIILSTLGGVFFLGERRSRRGIVFVIFGCLLIIAGGFILGYTKTITDGS